MKTILEPARETPVWQEADVVVVGGGPGGVASAICAARNGAKTVLVERYGYLGGMATGGLVNILPNFSDISGKQHLFGLNQELIDRLEARGAVSYPQKKDWGTTDRRLVKYYSDALRWFYIRADANLGGRERLLYSAVADPEILKDELNDMVREAGVELLLHSWVTQPIMDGNRVSGVICENKSGRQAVLGKVVIDSTGDGDIFVAAGAEYDGRLDFRYRTAYLALVFWVARVDQRKAGQFKAEYPEKYSALMEELRQAGGFIRYFRSTLPNQKDVIWYHCFQPRSDGKPSDAMDVHELTRVEVSARKRALVTYEFMKKHVPGFEKSHIMLSAPQLGLQGGRRVIGEYTLGAKDLVSDEVFADTIAVLANNDNGQISAQHPTLCVPYRCLVPKVVDGLLVACRAFSSEDSLNHQFNIIPHCVCYGQAAGTAAALAVAAGVQPRKVDYRSLRQNLVKQGVNLPALD